MKNEYISRVIVRLKRYRDLQAQHKMIINRYLSAGDPYSGISISYDTIPAGSSTNTISNRVEKAIIKSDEFLWKNSGVSKELQELDIAIEPLNELQKEIVKLKYIECKDWEFVADSVGYSVRQCKREGKSALRRMADILYGELSYIDLPIYEYASNLF